MIGDLLVIGAGLAGLSAAWRATVAGRKVRVVCKGWGATHWHAGCIDVLGYYPLDTQEAVVSPAEGIGRLIAAEPKHPYALLGLEQLDEALKAFQALCKEAHYPLQGSLERNWLLPSAVGTFRPTCLAPEMMTAGDLSSDAPMLLVGFRQLADFYPHLAADNLSLQGIPVGHVTLDLPALRDRNFTTSPILANLFEQPDFRAEVVDALKPHLGPAERVGFPAVLGLGQALAVKRDLEAALARPVFEIPGLPPSVAGMRLHSILVGAIEGQGGRVFDGMEAISSEGDNGQVTAVYTEAAARRRPHRFEDFILATGGILGGGLVADHLGRVSETVFDLPLEAPPSRLDWFKQAFLDGAGHPIYRAGLNVNSRFQPLDNEGRAVYENLYAAGTTLAHCEVIRERSFEGVALATGYVVGEGANR
jgi:glycerol-3-phosphate dehydrogenase subunit B